jgi:hypothetical protein
MELEDNGLGDPDGLGTDISRKQFEEHYLSHLGGEARFVQLESASMG